MNGIRISEGSLVLYKGFIYLVAIYMQAIVTVNQSLIYFVAASICSCEKTTTHSEMLLGTLGVAFFLTSQCCSEDLALPNFLCLFVHPQHHQHVIGQDK